MEPVRVGFVGAGFMGQLAHLWNYDQIDDCEVVALAEPQSRLAERVATRYDVPRVYDGYDAMLGETDLDAVVAAQPYRRHAHVVPDLLAAGVPLFTEKPAALKPETAERLADLADEAGVPHVVGYHKRSDPAMEYAKDVVAAWRESGDYGDLQYVRVTMPEGDWIAGAPDPITTDETPPAGEMEPLPERYDEAVAERYDAFVNYYIHQVNALRFFLEEEYALTHADEGGTLLVGETESAVTGTVEMSPYRTSGDWQESVLVGFDRGYVRVDLPAPLQRQTPGSVEVLRDDGDGETTTTSPALPPKSAMRRQAENFLAVVRGERDPPADVREGAADLRVAADYVDRRYGY